MANFVERLGHIKVNKVDLFALIYLASDMVQHFDKLRNARFTSNETMLKRINLFENVVFDAIKYTTFQCFRNEGEERDGSIIFCMFNVTFFVDWNNVSEFSFFS